MYPPLPLIKEITEEVKQKDLKQLSQQIKRGLGTNDIEELKLIARDPKRFIEDFTAGFFTYQPPHSVNLGFFSRAGRFIKSHLFGNFPATQKMSKELAFEAANTAKERFNLLYDTAQKLEEAEK